jgi:hypothetical protein
MTPIEDHGVRRKRPPSEDVGRAWQGTLSSHGAVPGDAMAVGAVVGV